MFSVPRAGARVCASTRPIGSCGLPRWLWVSSAERATLSRLDRSPGGRNLFCLLARDFPGIGPSDRWGVAESQRLSSAAGLRFVTRMLTGKEACREHDRNVFHYLARAIIAHHQNGPAPRLLPTS